MFIRIALVFALFSTIASAKHLDCSLDFAQFRRDDGANLWELYYSFPDTALRYERQNNGSYLGSMYCVVKISSSALAEPMMKEWIIDNAAATAFPAHTQHLVGVKSFLLAPGEYSVRFALYDLNDTTSAAEQTFRVVVKRFPDNRLALSDLQIASVIVPAAELKILPNPQFLKNSYYITPNPQNEYVGTKAILATYAEIYNARKFIKDTMIAEYRLYDGAKREVLRQMFVRAVHSDTQPEISGISLDSLPSGVYYTTLYIYSASGGADTAAGTEKFYLLNPAIPPKLRAAYSEDEQFQASEFSTLSPERTVEEYQKAKYIATRQELDLYAGLTETIARQKFLFRFWKVRDPDKETLINEKLEEYRDLIRFADANFGSMQIRQGWKTDKGRVLLKYGKPTQIDRYYTITETRPYEIWFYSHLQGGIQFSYVDLTGNGHFVLVHSTGLGELRNERWIEQFVRTTNDSRSDPLPSTPR